MSDIGIVGIVGFVAVYATIAIGVLGLLVGILIVWTRPAPRAIAPVILRHTVGPLCCAAVGVVLVPYEASLPGQEADQLAWAFPAGGILLWACLEIVIRGRTRRDNQGFVVPKDDPRFSRDETPPQKVGRECAACGRLLRTEAEAIFCEVCGICCHVTCLERHSATAHGPANGPFRTTDGTPRSESK